MMKQAKYPVEKPKPVPIDHVNDDLGSNYNAFEKLRFLSGDGKVVAKYKNTGTVLLANLFDKETKTLKNTGQLVTWEFEYPYMISIHDNDTVQLVNIETGQVDKNQGDKDTLKKVQCILFFEKTIFLISPTTVFIYETSNISSVKRVIPLQDSKDKFKPLININQHFSTAISATKLVLGNADVFQLWTISPDPSKKVMWVEFEGRNVNSQTKYFGVYVFGPTVVTTNRENFLLWDTSKEKEPTKNPKELKENGIITAVYLDEYFLILGTHNGVVSVRQRRDGDKIYDLNQVDANNIAIPKKEEGNLLEFSFESKINKVEKIGRWIFCSTENSRVNVFDLIAERADPVISYVHPKGGSVRDMIIDKNNVIFGVKIGKDTQKIEKPEVLIWSPKQIPGFEFYLSRKNIKTIDNYSLSSIISFSSYQIGEYFKLIKNAGEDITEFSTNVDRLIQIDSQLSRNTDVHVPFKAMKGLHDSLDEYLAMLEKLTTSGRLVRFFTSSRLRRGLEVQNTTLNNRLTEIEELLKVLLFEKKKVQTPPPSNGPDKTLLRTVSQPSISEIHTSTYEPMKYVNIHATQASWQASQPLQGSGSAGNIPTFSSSNSNEKRGSGFLAQEVMIHDPQAKEWWTKQFGYVLMVDWNKFLVALKGKFSSIAAPDAILLRDVLDHGYTGFVSQYRFSEWLKGFGPFNNCIDNFKLILNEKWFHGFLSSRESELLMKVNHSPDGTFLVRFSKSKPGSFALAFMKGGSCRHILIESNMPQGLSVNEQEGTGSARVFKSLHDIITHYNFVLKTPFISNLPKMDWFHGDINAEEANELLFSQPSGTYLIRFSSKGTFAASFVDSKSQIRHVLILSKSKDLFEVNTGDSDTMVFPTLEAMVKYYADKGVFKFALKTENEKYETKTPVQ